MKILLTIVFVAAGVTAALGQEDILEFAEKNPLGMAVMYSQGAYRYPKFGDQQLERAAERFKDRPRPWTVEKVLGWYGEAKDGRSRAHLLRILAASRDPRAAVALGKALDDGSLDVRLAATYGLLDYFVKKRSSGGTEQHIKDAKEWWKGNRNRLESEAKIRRGR